MVGTDFVKPGAAVFIAAASRKVPAAYGGTKHTRYIYSNSSVARGYFRTAAADATPPGEHEASFARAHMCVHVHRRISRVLDRVKGLRLRDRASTLVWPQRERERERGRKRAGTGRFVGNTRPVSRAAADI